MKSRTLNPLLTAACGLAICTLLVAPVGARQAAPVVKTPPTELPDALVIVGGGKLPDVVRDKFMDLAGGARAKLVVIPTASAAADGADADKALAPWRRYQPAA